MNGAREDKEEQDALAFTLRNIIRGLARLALEPDVQIELLEKAQLPSDELALDYEWAIGTVWRATEAGVIDGRLAEELRSICHELEAISGPGNFELWQDEALRSHPVWHRVRERARIALREVRARTGLPVPDESEFRAGRFDL